MKRLIFLAAGMFALGCDDFVFAGLLPSISASLHTSVAVIAQSCAAFGMAYIVSVPLCAYLIARMQVRNIIILALIIFILGNLMTVLSTHLTIYFISRCIAGLGAGLFLPVAVSAGTGLVEDGSRGRALSIIWGSNSAGAVVGVPLGLWLANKFNWRATLVLIIVLSTVTLIGTLFAKQALKVNAPPSLKEQFHFLLDRRVLGVIGVTLLTATGSLGLYAYMTAVLSHPSVSSDASVSTDAAFSFWNIGGLIGSIIIGYIVDRTGKPKHVMAMILISLIVTITGIPTFHAAPFFGFIPFLLWGALSWATVTPQQYSLYELNANHHTTLVALNSSAVSLGSIAGTALGGLAIASGIAAKSLPYFAAGLLLSALVLQMTLTLKPSYSTNANAAQ